MFQKKSALQTSLKNKNGKAIPCKTKHLKGKNRFRATVRLVIEYMSWIKQDITDLADDVTINIDATQEGQILKRINAKDRAVLLVKPRCRTKDEKQYVTNLVKRLNIFTKYPEKVKETLGSVCLYQYVPNGRTIVRQGHEAKALYCIIQGEVNVSKTDFDEVTGENIEIYENAMEAGHMFGEFALLHDIPRSATIISKTPVDLLYIPRKHFNRIMRNTVMQEWNTLHNAISNFDYFRGWDELTRNQCCLLSKIKRFKPNEIILGDGKGMINYVHFILSGDCSLIQHILVQKKCVNQKIHYMLYKPVPDENMQNELEENLNAKIELPDKNKLMEIASGHLEVDADKEYLHEGKISPNVEMSQSFSSEYQYSSDSISIATTTLFHVINQWQDITDIAALLIKEPTFSCQRYPATVKTIFMEVCKFYKGACFGLGEQMQNRRIIATTCVQCLLIPRYWIFKHNRANIWERVKVFLNSKFPANDKLFQEYVQNQRWLKYKKRLMKNIIKNRRQINSNTTIHDVPYSVRINNKRKTYF